MRARLLVGALLLGALAGCGRPALQTDDLERVSRRLSATLDCDAAALVASIAAANTAGPGPHTITLAPDCTYTLTEMNNGWYRHNGLPAITSDLTIVGNGRSVIERAVNAPKFRLFFVAGGPDPAAVLPPGKLTLKNLTLRGGLARGGNGGAASGGGMGAGGAVYVHGALALHSVTLSGNTA